MSLQDLTPQLRTRLSRVERAVGWFVLLAALLLFSGFGYYLYNTAQRKGWFLTKVPYQTVLLSATGLKVGDPVKLMGYDAGEITVIETMPPDNYYGIYVQMQVKSPYYGYLWKDSKAKVAPADFLGKRFIELTKGTFGPASVLETNRTFLGRTRKVVLGILDENPKLTNVAYYPITNGTQGYFLPPIETPALTEKLNAFVEQFEETWPELTNQVFQTLASATQLATHFDALVARAQPIATNVALITERLREPNGSLGEWLLPTNIQRQLETALTSANAALTNASPALARLDSTMVTADGTMIAVKTNLNVVVANLNQSLVNLADITGNLRVQVQSNSQMLSEISRLVIHADELVKGLKGHWLLKSAFKSETNRPPPRRR